MFVIYLVDSCQCTDEYNIEVDGKKIEARCNDWNDASYDFCYLSGGASASSCPGASKSDKGDFYWSAHSDICPSNGKDVYYPYVV